MKHLRLRAAHAGGFFIGSFWLLQTTIAEVPATRPVAAPPGGAAVQLIVIPPEDAATVTGLVDQLGADDPVDRDKATVLLEGRPDYDLPLIQAAAKRDDLRPEMKVRLRRLLSRMEPRASARSKRIATTKIISAFSTKLHADAYRQNGHANPAWDAAVKQTMDSEMQLAQSLETPEYQKISAQEQKGIDAALQAGCDDPDFLAIAGLFSGDHGVKADKVQDLFEKAMTVAKAGQANPYTKVLIDGRCLRARAPMVQPGATPRNLRVLGLMMNDMIGSYKEAVKIPDMPKEVLISMAQNVINTAKVIHVDEKSVFDNVYTPLEQSCPNEAAVLLIKGEFYISWAWAARGGGWANQVTPQGWKDFGDRLALANKTLTRAWEIDPTNPGPPTKMLTVALGQEQGRDVTEKWFKRAMEADPDNSQACDSKMYYLEPKWHGSAEDMIAFGRECFESRNWHGNVAFELVNAHVALSQYEQDPDSYFRNDNVWSDFEAVFNAYLASFPDDSGVRSRFANFACRAQRWDEANTLLKQLGDKVDPLAFGGADALNQMQQMAASNATKGGK